MLMRVKPKDLLKIFVLFLRDRPLEFLYFLIRQQGHGTISHSLVLVHLQVRWAIVQTDLVTFGRLPAADQRRDLALTAATRRLLPRKHDLLRLSPLSVLGVDEHVCWVRLVVEDVPGIWPNSYLFLPAYGRELFFGLVKFVVGQDHVFDFRIRIKVLLGHHGSAILFGYFQLHSGIVLVNLVLDEVQLLLQHRHLTFQLRGILDRRSLNLVEDAFDVGPIVLEQFVLFGRRVSIIIRLGLRKTIFPGISLLPDESLLLLRGQLALASRLLLFGYRLKLELVFDLAHLQLLLPRHVISLFLQVVHELVCENDPPALWWPLGQRERLVILRGHLGDAEDTCGGSLLGRHRAVISLTPVFVVFDDLFHLFVAQLVGLRPLQILLDLRPMGILVFENDAAFLEPLFVGGGDLLLHLTRPRDLGLIEYCGLGVEIDLASVEVGNLLNHIELVAGPRLLRFVPILLLAIFLDDDLFAYFGLILSLPSCQIGRENVVLIVLGNGVGHIQILSLDDLVGPVFDHGFFLQNIH